MQVRGSVVASFHTDLYFLKLKIPCHNSESLTLCALQLCSPHSLSSTSVFLSVTALETKELYLLNQQICIDFLLFIKKNVLTFILLGKQC